MSNELRADYFRNHGRVYAARGKASARDCARCDMPAKDWAQVHDTDGTEVTHYIPLCRSCHLRYDRTPEARSASARIAALARWDKAA